MLARHQKWPPAPPSIRSLHFPAPMAGLNNVTGASSMTPADCIQLYNLVASEYGLRSRLGYQEWCTGLTGASDNLVRTVMPYKGSARSGSADKVFATTSSGIWDVTASSAAPSSVFSFASATAEAGYGISHAFVSAAGVWYQAYADETNGLHVYTESTQTWAAVAMGAGATQISGVDPASFRFITVFKGRVWALTADTGDLWYSSTGALFGAYTKFALGSKLRAGGSLVGAWNWTYDGGNGIDDALVVVSSGGDVLIYQGTDPASATSFSLRGVWYAGNLPYGRRIANNFGGELLLLTQVGILPLSKLVVGANVDDGMQYSTFRVGSLFNQLMASHSTEKGWAMVLAPEDNALVVTVPTGVAVATEQLVMSLANKAWSRYRDLPIYSAESFKGQLYFGTTDGRVCINTGYVDGVLLADPNAFTPVQWALLSSFQGGDGRQKKVEMIRATVLSGSGVPSFDIQAKYKYDFTELATVPLVAGVGGLWGTAIWGVSLWGGAYSTTQELRGSTGMGSEIAIAIRGTATSRTVFIGADVYYRAGGPL